MCRKQVFVQVGVRVREAVRKINCVIVAGERMRKRQRVVVSIDAGCIFEIVLKVAYVRADPMPTELVCSALLGGETQNAHPLIIQTVRLRKVDYVQFDGLVLPCVRTPKKVPLGVPIRIDIVLQD